MDNIALFLDKFPWISIAVFTIFQLAVFIHTILKLRKINEIFKSDSKWKIIDNKIVTDNPSAEIATTINEINEYIERNEGTTDFIIIKEKIQNKIDSLYEEATSKISFPTYLGLMGTFFGVWIGLWSFKIGLGSGFSDEKVSDLIAGIIVSMVTSLVGLLLMMFGNAKASSVLKNVEADKNIFFDFLQLNLMPLLGTSMVSSLNKLHNTINTFEPSFKNVIDNFKLAFNECTDTLRGTFGEKVQLLTSAVESMGANMSLINENVKLQEQLLKTLRQRETLQTLEQFATAADKFNAVTNSIHTLSDVKEEIVQSTTKLIDTQSSYIDKMVIPERVFEKINAILNRIVTFEESINKLGESIKETQLLGNTEMNLIQEQIDAIKKKTDIAISYQDIADKNLIEIYEQQCKTITDLNEKYRLSIDTHGENFEAAMRDFQSSFTKIVQECMSAIEEKREEFMDEIKKSLNLEAENKHLAKLEKLPEVLKLLSSIEENTTSQLSIINNKISEFQNSVVSQEKKSKTSQNIEKDKRHWSLSLFKRKQNEKKK